MDELVLEPATSKESDDGFTISDTNIPGVSEVKHPEKSEIVLYVLMEQPSEIRMSRIRTPITVNDAYGDFDDGINAGIVSRILYETVFTTRTNIGSIQLEPTTL